jgi:hypothetical protein
VIYYSLERKLSLTLKKAKVFGQSANASQDSRYQAAKMREKTM